MFVTNWNSTTKIQKISEITNFFRHYFLSRTEVFMFSVIESCNMNKLSPGCYIKELVSRLTAKPVCTAEKVALLPCFMQK